ncbi:MAG: hypothetical protein J6Q62_01970 [Alistipes sp.]|nr:hypothetical protein [Alistipes sp.]
MKRISLMATALLSLGIAYGQNIPAYHDTEIEASKEYVEGNAYQKDLLLYADMLGDTHPYYANAEHRAKLQKRVRKMYKECGKIDHITEFKLYLAKVAASLHDGHTAIYYWSSPDRIFPVRFTINGNAPSIVDLCQDEYRDILGKEVKFINGKPLNKILNAAREIVSADNAVNFENLVQEYLLLTDFWAMMGMSDEVLNITFTDGSTIAIPAINKSDLKIAQLQKDMSGRITAPRRALFDYTIYEDKGICYMQFNQFADRVTHPQYTQLARFDEFVRDMMADMEAKNVKTLVVDLQYNSGGNSVLGNVLLSWLKPYRVMKQFNTQVRISELMLTYYPYYKEFTYDGKPLEIGETYLARKFDHNRDAKIDYTAPQDSARHVLNLDPERIFKGDVIFIQGKDSFSSAMLLLTTARDNYIGSIVGERSGGRPSHYGDILYCRLPNTGTMATVSHKIFLRPSYSPVEDAEYLYPDLEIDLNDPQRDLVWEFVETFTRKANAPKSEKQQDDDDSYLWDTIYSPAMQ